MKKMAKKIYEYLTIRPVMLMIAAVGYDLIMILITGLSFTLFDELHAWVWLILGVIVAVNIWLYCFVHQRNK